MAKINKSEKKQFSNIHQVLDTYLPSYEMKHQIEIEYKEAQVGKKIATNLAEVFHKKIISQRN